MELPKTWARINVEIEVYAELKELKNHIEKQTELTVTWTQLMMMLVDCAGVKGFTREQLKGKLE